MRILIDGHNLIPYIPGLNLSSLDDEQGLLERLQVYARESRHTLEVFFDGAPPGKAGKRAVGTLSVTFVSAKNIADNAIRDRLAELGPQAKQVTVVSSDRQVQTEARHYGARPLHSDQFARELLAGQPPKKPKKQPVKKAVEKKKIEPPLPADQVQEWMDLFKSGKK